MTAAHSDDRPNGTVARCSRCSAPLGHDQRYCIECGERRDELPRTFAELVAPAEAVFAAQAAEAVAAPRPAMPTPHAAAVAVTVLLAFGVFLGSVVSPAEESAAQTPIVVAVSPPAPAPAATPAPAPPAPGDTAPAPPAAVAAPAPVTTVTTPVPAQPAPTPAPTRPTAPPITPPPLPPIQHVFVVMLSDHGYNAAFGPDSQAPYLSKTLPAGGELLSNYYAVTHAELANGVALVSGQGPTPQNAANCPQYSDISPGTTDPQGQVSGDGCVYPAATHTLGDQLTGLGETWKAYVEDMGAGAPNEPASCRHPALGSADPDQQPRPGDAYVTWRNPFVYFHSLIDSPTCAASDLDLSQLGTDLKQVGDTPAVSYIVPNRCHDGSDQPCAPDHPAGIAAADTFLQTLIPEIEASPAYKQGGLIAITFDQAPKEGPEADSSACCDTPQYPNMPADTGTPPPSDTGTTPAPAPAGDPAASAADTTTSPPAGSNVTPTGGGGRVGLLLISPYVKPGTVNTTGYYNHFSLLRSIEDLFSLDHLGYAGAPTMTAFDKSVYTAYGSTP